MDTETLQAIQIIDKKISALQAARNQLAQAFGVEPPTAPIAPARGRTVPPPPTGDNSTSANGNGSQVPSGRKVELARYLLTNGPALRTAIVENSGLPEGTVSYCLSDKRFFEQNDNGTWKITDFSRRGLERGFGAIAE
jgi:hypothetical protein